MDLKKLLRPRSQNPQAPGGVPAQPGPGMGAGFRGGRGGGGGQRTLPGVPPGPREGETGNQEGDEPLWVTAYLEIKQAPKQLGRLPLLTIDHPWGGAVVSPPWLANLGTFKVYNLSS